MKRKDGKPKAKALRNLPRYSGGHKDSLNAVSAGFHDEPLVPKTVLSLFSGCGGLDLGFHGGFRIYGQQFGRTSFKIIHAFDFDKDCVDSYQLNIGKSELADLSSMNPQDLPASDVLIGGFPCQDFSSSGSKLGTTTERGQLYKVLINYAAYHRPKIVVGENVPMVATLHNGIYLREIGKAFEEIGYRLNVWKIVCQDHGLPQSRTRLFLIATEFEHNFPSHPILPKSRLTIDEAIDDLKSITDETVPNQSQYFVADVATNGGGQGDHKNPSGGIAYTIRANARARIQFHHKLDRRLTVRECARLQGFPDSFVFPYSAMRNMKLIGNAVPPIIAHQVALQFEKYLDGFLMDDAIQPLQAELEFV